MLANIDDAFLRHELQDLDIADAGFNGLQPVEDRQPRLVGGDHPAVGIEKGEPVLNGFDGMPQAALGDFDLLIGHRQVGFDAPVFVADGFHLGAGFDNLIRQPRRMLSQLAVRGLQLGLFLFQQPFGGKACAPLFGQLVGKAHAPSSDTPVP